MTGRLARKVLTALGVLAAALGVLAAAGGCAAPGAPAHPASAHPPSARTTSVSAGQPACPPFTGRVAPPGFVDTIKNRGYLIAGVDQTTYHFGYLNPIDGQIEGFDISMIDAVAQAIFGPDYARQHRIQFKAILNNQRIPDLRNGTVDIVADTFTINRCRQKSIDFSDVYYDAHAELLVLNNSKAKSLTDLKGQKVCALHGSDDIALIDRAGAIPVEPPYWTDCLVDLQQGTVSGIVTDDSILHGLQAQDPFTRLLPQQLEDEPYGLGISKAHPDFVQFVNTVLSQIEQNQTWQYDYQKWVGAPVQPPPPLRPGP